MKSTEKKPRQRCFILEGNIGAGKSTFLKILQKYLNVQIVLEPHERWQNILEGENLLDRFYRDPQRWAYTFQSYAFVSRVMEQEKHASTNPFSVQLLERSVFSDRYCFAQNCFELGYMSALEWKLYQEWFEWLVTSYVAKPDGIIYVRTNPDVCFQRLNKRSRSEESTVSMEYLQRLHDRHERWLIDKENVMPALKGIPVLVLECDGEFEHNRLEREKHIDQVGTFVLSHIPGVSSSSPLSPLSL
jgi:deoxyadenosine/deoxycytidine kinase